MNLRRRHVPRATRALGLLVACAALALIGALPAPAAAAALRPCELSLHDQDPPCGTSAYDLAVRRARTTCDLAKRVMVAFHRCRTETGASCGRVLLGSWRCSGTRRQFGSQTAYGAFTCRSRGRHVTGSYQQETPPCFGAAARDPKRPCFNAARNVVPGLADAESEPTVGCDETIVIGTCVFGYTGKDRRSVFAVIGDSHVYHWRPPLSIAAQVLRWTGYSFSSGGCFFSAVAVTFSPPCEVLYQNQLAFLRQHPEVTTVFVTQNADTPVAVGPGETYLGVRIDGFVRAWQAIPSTVKHIIVLRDTTITSQATIDCLTQAIADGKRLSRVCPGQRSIVLRPDTAVAAVRQLDAPRYQSIDLSNFLCGPTLCYPVVGGTRPNGDIYGHLMPTFTRTLGPYLLRDLRRLMASW